MFIFLQQNTNNVYYVTDNSNWKTEFLVSINILSSLQVCESWQIGPRINISFIDKFWKVN
jgi:hypothetical protein